MTDIELVTHVQSYSIANACDATGIKRSSIFEEIREGRLKARKFGRRTLILRSDLMEWLHALPLK